MGLGLGKGIHDRCLEHVWTAYMKQPASMDLHTHAEKAEAENKKLRNILESLLGACMYADMNGELAENIHGDILDQAREALK